MQVRTIKGGVKIRLLDVERRRLCEAKEILLQLGRFTNRQVFDAASDSLADAIAACEKLDEPELPLLAV